MGSQHFLNEDSVFFLDFLYKKVQDTVNGSLKGPFELPLPLGEGWGEGLATRPKTLPSRSFFIGADKKTWRRVFHFLLLGYALTPALSQAERAFTYKILAH